MINDLNKYDLKIQLSQIKIRFGIIANTHQYVCSRYNTGNENICLIKQCIRHNKGRDKRLIKLK